MIDEVISDSLGWLVIYSIVFGQPGEIIGFSPVSAGINTGVMVRVDVSKATDELYAVLHIDTEKLGAFEFPGPDVPRMREDVTIQAVFQTKVSIATSATPEPELDKPTLAVEDQPIRGDSVRVPYTISPVQGFMTIHNLLSDGRLGPIIGWTAVKSGENRDIIVKIDISGATETLVAMLHMDKSPIGILEFPGPDEPVMVDGQMLSYPFKITGGLPGSDITVGVSNGDAPYLVGVDGLSLYTSTKDSPRFSRCVGVCQNTWLPVFVSHELVVGAGVAEEKLGILLLPDGRRQAMYDNMPLYYYVGDQKPGDKLGHGVEGLWFLATP